MKKVLYIVLASLVLMTSMNSCEKWLDVNTSQDDPTTVTCGEWLNVNTDPDSPSNQSATEEVRLPWIQYYYSYAWGTANTRASAIAQVVMGTSRTATVGEQALWNPDTGVSTTVSSSFPHAVIITASIRERSNMLILFFMMILQFQILFGMTECIPS